MGKEPQELSKQWPHQLYRLEMAGVEPDRAEFLVPLPGTRKERDLFDGFGEDVDRRSLAVTLASLPVGDRGKSQLTEDDRKALVAFTSTWGLLGLFHQSLVLQQYVPDSEGWLRPLHRPPSGLPEVFESLSVEWPVPVVGPEVQFMDDAERERLDQWERTTTDHGLVWNRPAGTADLLRLACSPLPLFYRRFFPTLPPDGPFPHFNQPQFWDHYAEDLGSFLVAIQRFQRLYRVAENAAKEPARRSWLEQQLAPYLVSIHPTFAARADGSPAMGWFFPSLLSVGYFQLYHRLVNRRFPRFCRNERCSKAFIQTNRRQDYCEPVCENRAAQRRFKQKAEREKGATPGKKENVE